MNRPNTLRQGFTLIELSIVLVIIGLIIGGVLIGQDLIKAAATRATIAQVEKYNAAVNTFKNKYGGIPGDLILSSATQFGFVTTNCDGLPGARDGNGLIDGYHTPQLLAQSMGETGLFWSDLSQANFIDGSFPNGGGAALTCYANGPNLSSTTMGQYYPAAKIGNGNYFYVYETGGNNWFGLATITAETASQFTLAANVTVNQAYNMDKKIDDGLPVTGNVQAVYISSNSATSNAPSGNPDTASTCYNSSTLTYSTNVSNGSGPNCALSFKMQGAGR